MSEGGTEHMTGAVMWSLDPSVVVKEQLSGKGKPFKSMSIYRVKFENKL